MLDVQASRSTTRPFTSSTSRGGNQERGRGRGRGDRGGHPSQRRNRADFSQAGPNHDRSITTVVVEQIPEESFEEKTVREFFSDFGNIAEVTMQAYKRLAVVKFDDYYSAKRAYESPKVIFDNRFVKVYWYNPDTMTTPTSANGSTSKGASEALNKLEEPVFDKEKFERDSLVAQKKLEDRKALQQGMDAKRKEIERQKEELDQKRAEERKKLEEKLKAKGMSMADVGLDVTSDAGAEAPIAIDGKASAQTAALRAQVAALEEEARSMGIDPSEPFPSRGRGRGRGRGSYRGWEGFAGRGGGFESSRGAYRGRGAFRGGARGGGVYNLDNRPKKVKVEGVEFDETRDEGLKHFLLVSCSSSKLVPSCPFAWPRPLWTHRLIGAGTVILMRTLRQGIGEFESIESTVSKDAQIITFKDRFTAEKLMYGTKDVPGVGKVEFSWVSSPLPPVTLPSSKHDDGDMEMGGVGADGGTGGDAGKDGGAVGGHTEVDYDVAEEDDRWMVS